MRVNDDVGLPAPLPDALSGSGSEEEKIERHNFRVSTLIESPRIAQLKRLHWNEIEVPATQQAYAMVGTAIYGHIEKHIQQSGADWYLKPSSASK